LATFASYPGIARPDARQRCAVCHGARPLSKAKYRKQNIVGANQLPIQLPPDAFLVKTR
jgi:hypothetical protein